MEGNKIARLESIMRYDDLIRRQTGRAVRPYRADGYVNLLTKYGTDKDSTEQFRFQPEDVIADDLLARFYEGNGLFAKIIDTPAEEAIKHGFSLEDLADQEIEDFYTEALDELDWEETAMTAIKWARLYGGSIVVMLINDGRGLEEPLDWRHIKSIDDIRVYDRSVLTPDYSSMFSYDPCDPFRTRGSRLGMPEYYYVASRFGTFTVHDSRCLVFQNGVLPENTPSAVYQLWGVPEYVRIQKAIRDAEVSHGTATKMLDRAIQAVYKMKGLAAELATEQGEDRVLRRLQTIDMARGLLNSITIDSDGEDYDFRTFSFTGVSEVIDASCNFLSALTSIPQTLLFGRAPAGMNSTGESDLENYYNFVERIDRRMVKKNLRYLLSVIFQAGVATGEIDEVPKIKVKFNPLWSLSDLEQATLDQTKAATQQVKAATAQVYVDMGAIDPSEVRKKLADSEDFDVENMLDEVDEEELFANMQEEEAAPGQGGMVPEGAGGQIAEEGDFASYTNSVSTEEHEQDPGTEGSAPAAAPAATKLPQDMSDKELEEAEEAKEKRDSADPTKTRLDGGKGSVAVIVVKDGEILTGTRNNDTGHGLICGPGGHIEPGETPREAAIRETIEEFGIIPKELWSIGNGPEEPETGLAPFLFLCTEYDGDVECDNVEMVDPAFRSLSELYDLNPSLFPPFRDGIPVLCKALGLGPQDDGGPGSGNFGHKGRPGEIGGSAPGNGGTISNNERRAIIAFTGSNYTVSNEQRAHVESAIKKSEPLDPEFNYSRGVALTKEKLDKLISDGVYSPGRLTSWSTSGIVAENFADEGAYESIDTKFPVVLCYRGMGQLDKGMDVTSYSQHPDEDEIVFSSGIRMKIAPNEILGYNPDDTEPSGTIYINLYDDENTDGGHGSGKRIRSDSDFGKEFESIADSEDNSDGGPGSGNHGHEGRPGEIGGSAPSGALTTSKVRAAASKGDAAYSAAMKNAVKSAPVGSIFTVESKKSATPYKLTFKKISETEAEKETDYEGDKFTETVPIGESWNGLSVNEEVTFHDVESEDIAAAKVKSGEMEPGDTTVKVEGYQDKPFSGTIVDVDSEQYGSLRKEIGKHTGEVPSDAEMDKYLSAIDYFRGADYTDVVAASSGFSGIYKEYADAVMDKENREKASEAADTMERFIQNADKYNGKVQRAMAWDLGGPSDDGGFDRFMSGISEGSLIDMGHLSSWTTNDSTISQVLMYRHGNDEEAEKSVGVVLTCQESSHGVDIGRFSKTLQQGEVAFSKDQKWKVKSVTKSSRGSLDEVYEIEVSEVGPRGDSADGDHSDGGPGSGNWGHAGVPGQLGGSAPGSGGKSSSGSSKRASAKSYTPKEHDAVSYWKTGNEGYGYANIRSIANGGKCPDVEEEIKRDNISKAQHIQDELEKIEKEFSSAVKKAPSPDGVDLIRITGSHNTVSEGDEIDLRKYESFSSKPNKSMFDNLGSEGCTLYKMKGDDLFADISGIGDQQIQEHECITRAATKCVVDKVEDVEMFGKKYRCAELRPISTSDPEVAHRDISKEELEKASKQKQKSEMADILAQAREMAMAELRKNRKQGDSAGDTKEDGGPGSGNFGHAGRPGELGGSAPGGGSKSSGGSSKPSGGKSSRSYKDLNPKDSYVSTSKYKDASSKVRECIAKKEAVNERRKEIEKALESESRVKPRSEWTEEDEYHSLLGERPMEYTEKGKKLKEELDKAEHESMQLQDDLEKAMDKVHEMKTAAHFEQVSDWKSTKPEPTDQRDFKGFTTETTGTSYSDECLENGRGYIAKMSPEEYIKRCAFDIFTGATIESTLGGCDESTVKKYEGMMRDGTKFDMPYLDYGRNGQEGRHRALAAYNLGIDEIPVLVIGY